MSRDRGQINKPDRRDQTREPKLNFEKNGSIKATPNPQSREKTRDRKGNEDDTDEETITTVKMQLRAALMEEVLNHMRLSLFQLGSQ